VLQLAELLFELPLFPLIAARVFIDRPHQNLSYTWLPHQTRRAREVTWRFLIDIGLGLPPVMMQRVRRTLGGKGAGMRIAVAQNDGTGNFRIAPHLTN
jgi:hypothetical protein